MEETNDHFEVVVQNIEDVYLQKDKVAVYDPFQPRIGIVVIDEVLGVGNVMVVDNEDHSNNYLAQVVEGIVKASCKDVIVA